MEVLERAGFQVEIPPVDLCCGRPLFDQGMLDTAKRWLKRVIVTLGPMCRAGKTIVGLEPSCLLTFRDELPHLFPRDSAAAKLAQSSLMLDEFLAREAPDLPLSVDCRGARCCMAIAIKRRLPDLTAKSRFSSGFPVSKLQVPDSGCCGMAGAFGYDADHFEVSRAIGERVLLPAVRASDPQTIIISDGFSCRSQIAHFCPGPPRDASGGGVERGHDRSDRLTNSAQAL